jgi:uncharacterized protein
VITLDTSALFVVFSADDQDHARVRSALLGDRGPYLVPAATLGEVAYLFQRELPPAVLDAFLDDLLTGGFTLDCGERDFPRVRELVRRYADLPLGLVDAAVIACAERNGGRVLTLDLRHFGVVAREGTISILP